MEPGAIDVHVGVVEEGEAQINRSRKSVALGGAIGGVLGALAGIGLVAISYQPGRHPGLALSLPVAAIEGLIGGAGGASATLLASEHFGETRRARVFRGVIGGSGLAAVVTVLGHIGVRNLIQRPSWQLTSLAAGAGVFGFFPSAFMEHGLANGIAGTFASLGYGGFISLGVAELAEKVVPFIGRHSYSYTSAGWFAFIGFMVGALYKQSE